MNVRRFDPDGDLIIVKAHLFGKHGGRPLSLALDTAASHTHISSDIVDDLGYSPIDGEAITSVRSAIGNEPGYTLRVKRFQSLGFGFDDFLIHVHDLPGGFGIDGLLGLSFLKRFNYEIRSAEGRILVERVA
ncbi:MAG: retropepsin-like aspartic protease [Kofleriaceae bacterium]